MRPKLLWLPIQIAALALFLIGLGCLKAVDLLVGDDYESQETTPPET